MRWRDRCNDADDDILYNVGSKSEVAAACVGTVGNVRVVEDCIEDDDIDGAPVSTDNDNDAIAEDTGSHAATREAPMTGTADDEDIKDDGIVVDEDEVADDNDDE